jgi:hypothetical protein
MSSTSLGAELQQLSHLLEVLIIREPDIDKARQLSEKHQEVLNIIRRLVDINVNAATKEYIQARESVEQANAEAIVAIQDLAKVAKIINTIAKVVDILGKLAAAAA